MAVAGWSALPKPGRDARRRLRARRKRHVAKRHAAGADKTRAQADRAEHWNQWGRLRPETGRVTMGGETETETETNFVAIAPRQITPLDLDMAEAHGALDVLLKRVGDPNVRDALRALERAGHALKQAHEAQDAYIKDLEERLNRADMRLAELFKGLEEEAQKRMAVEDLASGTARRVRLVPVDTWERGPDEVGETPDEWGPGGHDEGGE